MTGRVDGLPVAFAVSAAHDVWVVYQDGTAQIDPRSLRVVRVVPVGSPPATSIRATDRNVWIREDGGRRFVVRVDPQSGEVTRIVTTRGRPSGGDVAEFAHTLWVSSYEEYLLMALDRHQLG